MVFPVSPWALTNRQRVFDYPDKVSGLNAFCPLSFPGPLSPSVENADLGQMLLVL